MGLKMRLHAYGGIGFKFAKIAQVWIIFMSIQAFRQVFRVFQSKQYKYLAVVARDGTIMIDYNRKSIGEPFLIPIIDYKFVIENCFQDQKGTFQYK